MASYAIGDVQGCFTPLKKLLEKISFDPTQDCLWFTGDLVNRGPDSLETLRFIKSLGKSAISVLGNHDLSLLAIAEGAMAPENGDTLAHLLKAPDCDELLSWLKHRPLMHIDNDLNYVMLHAGLIPQWDIPTAKRLATEVEDMLKSNQASEFFKSMYGDKPDIWDENLSGWERLRLITNVFTRIRFCSATGKLNLTAKGPVSTCPAGYRPWFEYSDAAWQGSNIIFGHWASLNGQCHTPHLYALDTGCVWGNCLTALCLETKVRFQINCEEFQHSPHL